MTSPNPNDVVVLWDAPKIIPPEFRLYYNKETGHVLFYTGEKAEGDFIVIDAITFAAARSDLRIINGKISTVQAHAVVHKLMPDVEEGQACAEEDISIIIDAAYSGNKTYWKLTSYEL